MKRTPYRDKTDNSSVKRCVTTSLLERQKVTVGWELKKGLLSVLERTWFEVKTPIGRSCTRWKNDGRCDRPGLYLLYERMEVKTSWLTRPLRNSLFGFFSLSHLDLDLRWNRSKALTVDDCIRRGKGLHHYSRRRMCPRGPLGFEVTDKYQTTSEDFSRD